MPTKEQIKEYLDFKTNPALALYRSFQDMKKEMERIRQTFGDETANQIKNLKEQGEKLQDEIKKEVGKQIKDQTEKSVIDKVSKTETKPEEVKTDGKKPTR